MVTKGDQFYQLGNIRILNGLVLANFEQQASQGECQVVNAVCTTRKQYGLPENAIVYCNFNQLYKLDPKTMGAWCNILKAVPNSVVWLLRFPALGERYVHEWCQRYFFKLNFHFFWPENKKSHCLEAFLSNIFLKKPKNKNYIGFVRVKKR